jgi:hypothetical protein
MHMGDWDWDQRPWLLNLDSAVLQATAPTWASLPTIKP